MSTRGNIVKIFGKPGDDENWTCDKCEGDEKGAPVLGLMLIKGMQRNGLAYENGTIMDPRDGSVYRALMNLSPDGKKLEVRGYLGISLFGRSQIWNRLPDNALDDSQAAGQGRGAGRNETNGASSDLDNASVSVLGAEGEHVPSALQASAVTAALPAGRANTSAPSSIAHQQHQAVGIADRHHLLVGMAGHDLDLRLRRRKDARRLAHGTVLALERPQDQLGGARGREPLAAGAPVERAHARVIARHPHVLAVGEPPAVQGRLLHGR